jgi:hypothetical protein
MGGSVDVESEVGQGSKFNLTFKAKCSPDGVDVVVSHVSEEV